MVDRRQMDGPATGIAIVLGVLLLAAGAAGIALTGGLPDKTYAVAWSEQAAQSAEASLEGAPAEATLHLQVPAGSHLAGFTITFPTCEDSFTAPLQEPASIDWLVERTVGGQTQTVREGSTTCAAADTIRVEPDGAGPGDGQVEAADRRSAVAAAEASAPHTETDATYTLQVEVSRPGGPVPGGLPGLPGGTSFQAELLFTAMEWTFAVSEKVPEEVHQ